MKFFRIIQSTVKSFFRSDQMRTSAALAYYTLFSLPAVLFIIIRISDIFIDPGKARRYIYTELGGLIGSDAAQSLEIAVSQIEFSEEATWKIVVSVVVLVFTASNIFSTLQNSFNHILGVNTKAEGWYSILILILKRIWSIGILLGLAIILLISLVIDMAVSALSSRLLDYLSRIEWLMILIGSIIIPVIVMSSLFILLFKVLPDVKLKMSEVLTAALLTSFLFLAGKFAIGYYIGNTRAFDIYSSAAAIIAILLWSYYSTAIILFGCSFLKEKMEYEDRELEMKGYLPDRPVQL